MSPYLGLLRNRTFVIYWTGSTIVQLGLQFSTIALIWFVLQTTGSATRIGIILALFPLSRMVTSPFIGFTLGLIWSSFAVGALFGTFLWSRFRPNWTLRVVISGIIFCWGVFSGGIGLAAHPWQAMVMMFFGGVTFAPYNILAATWEQRLIPDQHRGKVYGVIQSITSVGLPIGQLAGGFMVKGIGASATILVGGIATVLLGIIVISLRGLWRTTVVNRT